MKKTLLDVAEVQTQLLAHANARQRFETVALPDVLGRVLAQDYIAAFDVPSADNSAMDGYAVRASDLLSTQSTYLTVSQYISAGKVPEQLLPNTAARIFTGAQLPLGADTIVLQENCTVENEKVIIPPGHDSKTRQYIRQQGSDFKKGETILKKGTRVDAKIMGMLATLGVRDVSVYQPLTVAICSTGDELLEPGDLLVAGKLYNSNRFMLRGLLQQMGVHVIDMGAIKDDYEQLTTAFIKSISQADFLISSGGASEGDKDFIHQLVTQLGKVNAWKLAIKPGKPFLFGELTDNNKTIPFFGLPGNPVSAFVTFLILVKPYLQRCQGLLDVLPTTERVRASFTWQTTNRQEYVRVQKKSNGDQTSLIIYGNQNSAVLSSIVWASGLAIVPPNTRVKEGDYLDYMAI